MNFNKLSILSILVISFIYSQCENDYTNYGSANCDTAWEEFETVYNSNLNICRDFDKYENDIEKLSNEIDKKLILLEINEKLNIKKELTQINLIINTAKTQITESWNIYKNSKSPYTPPPSM